MSNTNKNITHSPELSNRSIISNHSENASLSSIPKSFSVTDKEKLQEKEKLSVTFEDLPEFAEDQTSLSREFFNRFPRAALTDITERNVAVTEAKPRKISRVVKRKEDFLSQNDSDISSSLQPSPRENQDQNKKPTLKNLLFSQNLNYNPNQKCRLIDYFSIIAYNHESRLNAAQPRAIISFRCPSVDYEKKFKCSNKFNEAVCMNIQAEPWEIRDDYQPPKFFVTTLTDTLANRSYAAYLQFYEKEMIEITNGESSQNNLHSSFQDKYVPKALCIQSSQEYFTAFRTILNIIYTKAVYDNRPVEDLYTFITNATNFYVKNDQSMQYLNVTKLVPNNNNNNKKSDNVSSNSISEISSSSTLIGEGPKIWRAEDKIPIEASKLKFKQFLPKKLKNAKSPLNTIKPLTAILSTGTTCYDLLAKLGANDLVTLVFCALTSRKIVIYSQHWSTVSEACRAIIALLYPFDYCGSYPSLLTSLAPIGDFIDSPVPYLIGLTRATAEPHFLDMDKNGCVRVDLDGGKMVAHLEFEEDHFGLMKMDNKNNQDDFNGGQTISLEMAIAESKILESLRNKLANIQFPKMSRSDFAFIDEEYLQKQTGKSDEIKDKEIRTAFLMAFLELFKNYRQSIRIIRTHPEVITKFDLDGFLNDHITDSLERPILENILKSQEWVQFIEQRGSPYRWIDLFDKALVRQNIQPIDDHQNLGSQNLSSNILNFLINFEYPQDIAAEKPVLPKSVINMTKLINDFDHQEIFYSLQIRRFPELDQNACQRLVRYPDEMYSPTIYQNILNDDQVFLLQRLQPVPAHPNKRPAPPIEINRHLETLRNFMNCIFLKDSQPENYNFHDDGSSSIIPKNEEDKAAEAKRLLPAVLRQLKNKNARRTFVGIFINRMQLTNHNNNNNNHHQSSMDYIFKKVELGFSQFETLSDALKIVLTKDTYHSWAELEQFAIDLLPCITNVYRRLESTIIYNTDGNHQILKKGGRSVQQFLYATDEVQYNPLWFRESFWSNMFEQSVQHSLCQLHKEGIRQRPMVVECETDNNYWDGLLNNAIFFYFLAHCSCINPILIEILRFQKDWKINLTHHSYNNNPYQIQHRSTFDHIHHLNSFIRKNNSIRSCRYW